ncbi:conjugative transposon protein TraM [Pinibacter soli]|uniref:Conjugative transposon protein TraM n=1 Tax=Pinibacter soli TaxID=3044211 RepID=A0ABT6RFQ1_9BACT|nr:conjugative transposon protein TraM [Pinibacter soli]MDI3321358.1 conjugative transposon protein TraM [Pinibacter soli]
MLQDNSTKKGYTQKYLRQRKFLLFLPAFVLPLISFLLWSLGVIGSRPSKDTSAIKSNALNMTLPGANTARDSSWSKLNFYEAADKEAARKASLARNDPYYQLSPLEDQEVVDSNLLPVSTKSKTVLNTTSKIPGNNLSSYYASSKDPNEVKVYEKLEALNKALVSEPDKNVSSRYNEKSEAMHALQTSQPEIDKLEAMMQQLQNTGSATNPEMEQINMMLEKILDIQHPERIKEKFAEREQPLQQHATLSAIKPSDALVASVLQPEDVSTIIDTVTTSREPNETIETNKFYSLGNEEERVEKSNMIEAVVPEAQTLVSGAVIKLRLENDIYVNDVLVPKGTFVYGTSSINNERLVINISSIKCLNNILPVALSVYDLDGLEGIYTPGAITRDVAKQSSDQAMQGMSLSALDNSVGAQAATAGIQAAKTLISKKAKLVRVTVSAGYRVLLRDTKAKPE